MAIASFLDKYFECVEYLPLDLQRCVTRLRAVDMEARGAVEDLRHVKARLHEALQQGNAEQQAVLFRQLQEMLVTTRDLGNKKLKVSAQMLEIVEEYGQQLQQRHKTVDHASTDEFYHVHRLSSGAKEHTPDTKSVSKRSTGGKRVRPQHQVETVDEDTNNGRSKESVTHSSNSALNNGRSAKKKVKTIKKKTGAVNVKMCTDESPPPIPAVPMPDLTSQPLDPDEPTYCLCQQVSFGEMIGCDNDECPIEWFHFQCVNLTSKPKGKWYCPQCSQGRKGSKPTK